MRILFLSDFHGYMPNVSEWEPELVIAGGDYCEVDEIRQLKFAAMGRGLHATQWTELVGKSRAEALVDRALAEGAAVVAALAECGVPVLAIPGNSDRVALYSQELAEAHLPRPDRPEVDGHVTNIETRVVVHEGVAFAGLGGWSGPSSAQRMDSELGELQRQVAGRHEPLVLVSHNVPYASRLDGVNNPDLPAFAQGVMAGSHRCLAALQELSPVLCLAGHLHENFGRTERIGRTLCICGAGAYRGDGVLLQIELDGTLSDPNFVTSSRGARRVLV
jgi:Icc-related predicted phosphoesterase